MTQKKKAAFSLEKLMIKGPAKMSTHGQYKIYSPAKSEQLRKLSDYSRCRVNTGKNEELKSIA